MNFPVEFTGPNLTQLLKLAESTGRGIPVMAGKINGNWVLGYWK